MANPNWDLSYLDPANLVRQTAKLLRGDGSSSSQVASGPSENSSVEVPIVSAPMNSKDLMIISGAAAFGGALVVAAVYATPFLMEKYEMQCPVCKCRCCACLVAQQHPTRFLKRLFKGISSYLNAGKARLLGGSSKTNSTPLTNVENVENEQVHSENNGNWTCVDEVVQESSDAGVQPNPYSPFKRKEYLSWDDYFMSIAFLSAQRSKDPIRQVGACLVGQDDIILGIGYNGFPRGCSDDKLPWAKLSKDNDILKTKYPYVCHAELNAILNRNHASASGQRLYTTMFPCNECAKLIIQAGISEVVFYMDKQTGSSPQFVASQKLLAMANVKIRQHKPKSKSIILQFE